MTIEIKVDGYTLFEMNTPKDTGYLQEQSKALQEHYNALLTEIANERDERDALRTENQRLRDALDSLCAWEDGELGGHMDEPHAANVARAALNPKGDV